MNLVFDIDDDDYISVTIAADAAEDELELHNLAQRLMVRSPGANIVARAKSGAFNHLSEEQYNTYLRKIKTIEKFFTYDLNGSAPIRQRKTNIFLLLERLINTYVNLENEEGGFDDE